MHLQRGMFVHKIQEMMKPHIKLHIIISNAKNSKRKRQHISETSYVPQQITKH